MLNALYGLLSSNNYDIILIEFTYNYSNKKFVLDIEYNLAVALTAPFDFLVYPVYSEK